MGTIYHLAMASDWEAARTTGTYRTSTRGRTLADEGFIHASRADQWPTIRDRFYADVDEPLLLLEIDPGLLDVPVVEEPGEPDSAETFPHIYGPLPVTAVLRATPVAPAPGRDGDVARPETFSSVFFREMFVNAGLICLVMLASILGLVAGSVLGDLGRGVGGVLGLLVGSAAARVLYVRRHASPEE